MAPSILATVLIRLFGLLVIAYGLFSSIAMIPMYFSLQKIIEKGGGYPSAITGKILGFEFRESNLSDLMRTHILGILGIAAVGILIIGGSRSLGRMLAGRLDRHHP